MISYPLKNKDEGTVLREIKIFFICLGFPKVIQTDKGGEFNNLVAKVYYENIGVKHIKSSPKYPQSNGQIEAQHTTLQKAISIDLSEKKIVLIFKIVLMIVCMIIII